MTIDEIHSEWANDSKLNPLDLVGATVQTPKLHHKYLMVLLEYRKKNRILRNKLAQLRRLKQEYYSGVMPKADMDELGWEPFQLKILKQDMSKYIDQDNDVIKLTSMIGEVEETIFLLDEILKQLHSRGFQIRQMIDWIKYENGA